MNIRLHQSSHWLGMILVCLTLRIEAAEPPETHWIRPFAIVGVSTSAGPAHRAAADKLAKALGYPLVVTDRNPVCCIWVDFGVPPANPGKPGYIILHQESGSLILASDQGALDQAIDRLISSSRTRDGKREVPEGLITTFPIYSK